MTPDDLAAIRARDEMAYDTPMSRIPARVISETRADRRALLAEVDRLTEDRDYWENLAGHALPYPEADVLRERARILAAVEALHEAVCHCPNDGTDPDCYAPWAAAVIAAIEGKTT
jgi:hypothetical protein